MRYLFSLLLVFLSITLFSQVILEQTFYYDGNTNAAPWTYSTIDVDSDGTVAVAFTRTLSAFNTRTNENELANIILFDKSGEQIGIISSRISGMAQLAYGYDGRIYTVEGWFGSGMHLYDRPGIPYRYVSTRFFNADGSHVDRGTPKAVAANGEHQIYTLWDDKLCLISPENVLLATYPAPPSVIRNLDVTEDDIVFAGEYRFDKGSNSWERTDYFICDLTSDKKALLERGGRYYRYDLLSESIEIEYALPSSVNRHSGDMALGPDGNIYYCPFNSPTTYYFVYDVNGEVLLSRGADFAGLAIALPKTDFVEGEQVQIETYLNNSRDLDYVTKGNKLQFDNRPTLVLSAKLLPVEFENGRFQGVKWIDVPVKMAADGLTATLSVPEGLSGRYTLKFFGVKPIQGLSFLEVSTTVTISSKAEEGFITLSTNRNRAAFLNSEDMRLTLAYKGVSDISTDGAAFEFVGVNDSSQKYYINIPSVSISNGERSIVLTISQPVLAGMKSGDYTLTVKELKGNIKVNKIPITIVSPVKKSDFVIPLHPIFVPSSFNGQLFGEEYHASIVSTNISSISNQDANRFLDDLTKYNVDFLLQPHGHFAALNSTFNETGAMRQKFAELAQTYQTFPSFSGFNYHDLISPFGTWWDSQREIDSNPINDEWKAQHPVPSNVPEQYKENYWAALYSVGRLPNVYAAWGDAIKQVSPDLIRTTQQWWHMPLYGADPELVAENQDVISTQHMEEQYYHPITVPNQADLWRINGKPLYVYGNNSWTDDGTGQEIYRETMSGLMRGVQGIGRDDLPQVADRHSETTKRAQAPLNELLTVYGGISANSVPVDDVAVWRSLEQEMMEGSNISAKEQHIMNTTAAYAACLYAQRTANIITDSKIRDGELSNYKALIISCIIEPSSDLQQAIYTFMADGGKVYANEPLNGYWRPNGAVELGQLFISSAADPYHNRDFLRFLDMDNNEGGIYADALLAAMGSDISPFAESNERTTWMSVLESGDAKYIITANMKLVPHDSFMLHKFSGYQNSTMPTKSEIYLKDSSYVVYDVLNGNKVNVQTKNGRDYVIADMSYFPGAIIAFLPKEISTIKVSSIELTSEGLTGELSSSLVYSGMRLNISVLDNAGSIINAAVPLEIMINEVNGNNRTVVYSLNRTTMNGATEVDITLPSIQANRRYEISVRELLSGIKATGNIASPSHNAVPFAVKIADYVEFSNYERVADGFRSISNVAIVATDVQHEKFKENIGDIVATLSSKNANVTLLTPDDYLADKKTYGYDIFRIGDYSPNVKYRHARYDIVVMLEGDLNKMYSNNILPIPVTKAEPGNGRGLIQFLVMPVYNEENGVSVAGGDDEGIIKALTALNDEIINNFAKVSFVENNKPNLTYKDIALTKSISKPKGLSEYIGVPASEITVSGNGKTIAVAFKGWGDNLAFLDSNGKVLKKVASGKFYPIHLSSLDKGFMVYEHYNDPNAMYATVYNSSGILEYRLAPTGRRIGGARDYPASHPLVFEERFVSQTSYSITPNGNYAAVGGTRGIAVWDLNAKKMLWHDDTITYIDGAGNASGYPQLSLSPDGNKLIVVYNNVVTIRNARNGDLQSELTLPVGAKIGSVQYNKNNKIIIGDSDFYAFDGDKLMWHFIMPEPPLDSAFADNAMDYVLGALDSSVKVMSGGFQVSGYVMNSGVPISVDILPNSSLVAFGGTTGIIGVMKRDGTVVWESNVGSRAAVSFAGTGGDLVVSDWKGNIYYFDSKGKQKWVIQLGDKVYRDDIVDVLLDESAITTYEIPRPYALTEINIPEGAENVAAGTTNVRLIPHRDWWNGEQFPQANGSVDLTNGIVENHDLPWYDRDALDNAAHVPSPPAWEISRRDGGIMRVNTIVIREDPRYPEAVPSEIKVEAFLNNEWIPLVHEYWNAGTSHTHQFVTVDAERIRYTPIGDLSKNIWLREIELYMLN